MCGFKPKVQRVGKEDVVAILIRLSKDWQQEEFEYFLILSWKLWHIRNNSEHSGTIPKASEVMEWCAQYINDYREAQVTGGNGKDRNQYREIVWSPPEVGLLKINVDASEKKGSRCSGISCVVRNENG
ncbi:hypothetical protein CsatB_010278 [Cannabis sativa]